MPRRWPLSIQGVPAHAGREEKPAGAIQILSAGLSSQYHSAEGRSAAERPSLVLSEVEGRSESLFQGPFRYRGVNRGHEADGFLKGGDDLRVVLQVAVGQPSLAADARISLCCSSAVLAACLTCIRATRTLSRSCNLSKISVRFPLYRWCPLLAEGWRDSLSRPRSSVGTNPTTLGSRSRVFRPERGSHGTLSVPWDFSRKAPGTCPRQKDIAVATPDHGEEQTHGTKGVPWLPLIRG